MLNMDILLLFFSLFFVTRTSSQGTDRDKVSSKSTSFIKTIRRKFLSL